MITFDEHGGCFDHVPPKPAVPPYIIPPYPHQNENGFKFERMGIRVPTVLVSSYIAEKTVIHTEFEHTSVIKTNLIFLI
jgi:phospholipase C